MLAGQPVQQETLSINAAQQQQPLPLTLPDLPLIKPLAGSSAPAAWQQKRSGDLLVNAETLQLLHYYLASVGELSEAEAQALINRSIAQQLTEPARSQALDLVAAFMRLRTALQDDVASGHAPGAVGEQLQWLQQRREQYLGEYAAALFGAEMAVQQLDHQRQQLLIDNTLSGQERLQQLQHLNAQLPAEISSARYRANAPSRVYQQVLAIRQGDGDLAIQQQTIQALREKHFGAAAMQRLAALDNRKMQWQQRLANYQQLRQALLADNTGLTDWQRQQQLNQLLNQHFQASEQLRVEILSASHFP